MGIRISILVILIGLGCSVRPQKPEPKPGIQDTDGLDGGSGADKKNPYTPYDKDNERLSPNARTVPPDTRVDNTTVVPVPGEDATGGDGGDAGTDGGSDSGSDGGDSGSDGGSDSGADSGADSGEPPDRVETPPEFEDDWTFYHYCVVAEDRDEAIKYLDRFPEPQYFEVWLKSIQVTVAAIRVRLPYARDGRSVQENCRAAYNLFKEQRTFSLAPDPAKNEIFNVENVDPIAGLPDLKGLDLRHNKVIQIKFLRNLTGLEFLDVSENLIATVPVMHHGWPSRGLYNLKEFGIEFQRVPGKTLAITDFGRFDVNLTKIRIRSNTVDPESFRGMHANLIVQSLRALKFVPGGPSCEPGAARYDNLYPTQVEGERGTQCD